MLKNPVNAHLDCMFEVHLSCETRVVVAEVKDVIIYSFIMLLLHLRQFNNG